MLKGWVLVFFATINGQEVPTATLDGFRSWDDCADAGVLIGGEDAVFDCVNLKTGGSVSRPLGDEE
jgi:hypothetical protein